MEKRIDKNDNKFERDTQTDEKKTLENENESVSIKDNVLEEKDGEIKKSFPKIFDAFDKNINDEYINIPNEYANLSEQAEKLLNNRGYYISGFDKDGNEFFHESKFNQFCRRISRCLASAEILYTDDIERIRMLEFNIYQDIFNKRFTFNSPALFNLGKGFCDNKERIRDHHLIYKKNLLDMELKDYEYIYSSKTTKQMLFACFVIGIEDNLESIMDGLKDAALVSKAGGGVGFNFGNTRERNALVFGGVCGKASGPVSWIHMYNEMGNSVVQGGTRRAALMGMLYDDNPDIFEFMHCKDEEGVLSKFNISVAVSNTLMDSIINNRPDDRFVFHSRKDGKEVKEIPTGVYKTNAMGEKEMTFMETKDITCGKVWNEICEHAWKRGDPGVFFIDNANYDNILKEDTTGNYIIESTNPCVTGDTLVSTPDGYKHAKDVKIGDYISTLTGPDKVDEIEVNENMQVYKVTMSDGDFVKVTESHKFHAIKKNSENKDYEYISLKDLEVGDYIQTVIDRDIDGKLHIIDTFIKSIEKMDGLHTVYDIHCPNDNWITNGYISMGCGEQPLPNFTSCNLGSINLNAFLFPNENGTLDFNIRELSDQIIRSIYYLDLIIDASSFPVKKIEERTKAIRPVGLGFMGLADLAFRCNLSYNSNEFKNLCNIIGQIYAGTSMYATIEICKENLKKPFQENNLVKILFKNNEITDELIDNGTIDEIISAISISKIPPTTINAIFSLKTFFNIYGETFEEYNTFDDFLKEMIRCILKGKIRNSRRLSEAPTGCQTKDTYITTDKGILRLDEIGNINSEEKWINISDINVEQEKSYSSLSKFYINGHSETRKITTQYGIELEATLNHKYRVLDENKNYIWKKVEDLKVGDILVYKIGEYENTENPKFDFNEYNRHPNANENIIFPENMNEDLAYFIGFYCGNGNLHKLGKRIPNELRLFFNKSHENKINKLKELCKKLFNYDIKTYISDNKNENRKNLVTLHIVSREIIYKLNKIGALKESSKTVIIPKIIRMSSKDCIKSFINGLYDADGSYSGNSVYIDTVSKQFAQELAIVMRAIGINVNIRVDTKRTGSKGKSPLYRICYGIYGSDNFKKEHERYIKCEYKNYHNDLIKISDRLYGEKIVNIEKSENDTFDLEVPETHYYIANSFISHNSTSMIMDASSGIEPLFALSWGRKVVSNKTTDDTTIQFSYIYKYLNDDERKKLENGEMLKGDKYLCANDLNIDDHLAPIGIFGKYIDSAISKTCNLPNSATVDDVKKAYEKAFKLGCKGITIYRDGSRDSQPITRTDNKVEVQKEKDGIRLVNKKRERPKFARGITENVETSNYGKLYVTVNFDEENEPFEVFISLGKSGSEITSLVDACARLISISLRSNTDIKDLIKTLINMDSSNPWLYDSDINGMVVMTSIPDAIAKLIIEIMDHKDEILSKSSECKCDKKEELDSMDKHIFKETALGGVIECPKCHKNTYTLFNGCRTCINPECGYSGCDAI